LQVPTQVYQLPVTSNMEVGRLERLGESARRPQMQLGARARARALAEGWHARNAAHPPFQSRSLS
jgi:hypothetical protein